MFAAKQLLPRTPVNAVPAMNQAKGSRYHGDTEMRYRLADTDTSVVTTAPHAFAMSSLNTCSQQQ